MLLTSNFNLVCIQRDINPVAKPRQPQSAESLPATPANIAAAALLAVSGGMLDAIIWLLHGHVFATAMTGNTVLLAVALLSGDGKDAVHHILPLFTFACGILLGWSILRRVRNARPVHHIALLIQMSALLLAGAAPAAFPSEPIIVLVALTASVQMATFQRIDSVNYNTTFITGNIRTLLEAAYDSFHPEGRAKAIRQIQAIGPVCLGFFIGALLGAALAPRIHNRSLWAVAAVLLIARILLR